MKKFYGKRILAWVLTLMMLVGICPMTGFAADGNIETPFVPSDELLQDQEETSKCDYYNVIEKNEYNLAPGAVEKEMILNDDTGENRNVVHVMEVDLKDPNISVMPTYKGISEDVDYSDPSTWGSQIMTEQVAHVEDDLGLNVVGAMNVSLTWSFDHPYGLLIYKGKVLYDDRNNSPGGGYLAIMKDGTAELRDARAKLTGNEWMAQTICFDFLLRDGKFVNNNEVEDHDSERAPRSVIGIKGDGTLVLMMNDGRQAPYSAGFTSHEMAQVMLDLGCVDAINCDGGGSSTFITERAGSGELSLKCRPSDGSQRETLTGIAIISNAISDGVFASATLTASSNAVSPNGSVTISAVGADVAGGPATLPEDLTLELADKSYGTINGSVFTASNKIGNATINAVSNGKVVGSLTIRVLAPDSIRFEDNGIRITSVRAIAGEAVELPLVGSYNNASINLSADGVTFSMGSANDGTFDGLNFIPNASYKGGKEVTITAKLNADPTKTASITVVVYGKYEVDFDFNNADGINSQKSLAWNRDIDGTNKDKKNAIYTITKHPSNNAYELEYTFGVDMTQVALPSGAGAALGMVDKEGSYNNAWEAMCSLAPRITTDTIITVQATMNKNVTLDVSDVFIVSDYFKLNSATVNSNNTLTMEFSWIAQASPVNFNTESPIVILSGIKGTISGLEVDNTYTYGVSNGTASYKVCMITSSGYENAGWIGIIMSGVKKYEKSEGAQSGNTGTQGISITKSDVLSFSDQFTIDTTWIHQEFGADGYYYVNNSRYHYDNYVFYEADGLYYYCPVNAPAFLYTGLAYDSENKALYNVTDGVKAGATRWYEDSYYVDGKRVASGVYCLPDKDGTNDSYYYNFNADGVLIGKYSGLIQEGELYRYIYIGELSSGWKVIDDEWYYFDDSTMAAVSGSVKMYGVTYHFEENGKLTSGVWANTLNGTRYYYGPTYYSEGWNKIDGEMYRFQNGYRLTGYNYVPSIETKNRLKWYDFGEDGICRDVEDGLYVAEDGKTYYIIDGINKLGLYNVDGDYYFFDSVGTIATGKCYVWETHCELPCNTYYFDESGKMLVNGIFEIEGALYYFVNGKGAQAGLVEMDGNYYFAGVEGKVSTGECYVWKGNDIVPDGMYTFADDGRMLGIKVVDGQQILGEIVDVNGELYYYKNGRKAQAGLIELNGSYYFAGVEGKLSTGLCYVWQGNGIVADGMYTFAENGRMLGVKIVDGQQVLGEIVDVNGELYYFKNGKQAQAGLVELNGNYYFAGVEGKLSTGLCYVWQGNGIVADGMYTFAENGRMLGVKIVDGQQVLGEIVDVNGELYYYKNGKQAQAGLIEFEGNYYFAGVEGKISTGHCYVWQGNGIVADGMYTFAENGRMLGVKIVDGQQVLGEIVDVNGELYYYKNGKQAQAGLIEFEGNYYFAGVEGKIATGHFYVWQGNGIVPDGMYRFAEDGKMLGIKLVDGEAVKGEVAEVNGELYYFVNGKGAQAGLVEFEGNYYFAGVEGKIATGHFYVWQGNGIVPDGMYRFAEDGRMLGIKLVDGETVKGEIAEVDGELYYFNTGKASQAGLLYIDGYYYFAGVNGKLIVNESYYVWEGNGLLLESTYTFDENGRLVK